MAPYRMDWRTHVAAAWDAGDGAVHDESTRRVTIVAGVGGALWLVGASLLPTFGMPALLIPRVESGPLEGWAIPTLVIIAAVLVGVLLGLISAALSALTAAGRRRRTRKRLLASVDEVVQRDVVAPVAAELDRARTVAGALAVARR